MSLLFLSFILSLCCLPTLYAQGTPTVWCGPFADTSIPCPDVNEPVCAPYPRYCMSTPCPQYMEFYNGCVACQDPTVTGYTAGRCVYTCATAELDQSNTVVCAIYQEGCQDASCRREFQNSFTACQDPTVVSFTIESCPVPPTPPGTGETGEPPLGESEETISIELPSSVDNETTIVSEEGFVNEELEMAALGVIQCPVIYVTEAVSCTEQYEPVCAYHYDCVGEDCVGMTVGNSCLACSQYGYDYYLDGACEMGDSNSDIVVSTLESGLLADATENWSEE